MHRFTSILAVVMVTIGLSTGASANDRQECAGQNHELRIAACTRLLIANPADFLAIANRGISYRITADYDRALTDIEAALRMRPNYAGLYLERALVFASTGQNAGAIRDFSEALRRDASLIVAYFGRAMAFEDIGQHERAKAFGSFGRSASQHAQALQLEGGTENSAAAHMKKALATNSRR